MLVTIKGYRITIRFFSKKIPEKFRPVIRAMLLKVSKRKLASMANQSFMVEESELQEQYHAFKKQNQD